MSTMRIGLELSPKKMKNRQVFLLSITLYTSVALLTACNTSNLPASSTAENPSGHNTQSQPMPSITSESKPSSTSLPRVMARLNGLSGDQDVRLLKLKERVAKLNGISLLTLGTTPSGLSPSQHPTQFSALMVFQIDIAHISMSEALRQIQALETFAYVEADQMLQKR
jgi:hypothetical protein